MFAATTSFGDVFLLLCGSVSIHQPVQQIPISLPVDWNGCASFRFVSARGSATCTFATIRCIAPESMVTPSMLDICGPDKRIE